MINQISDIIDRYRREPGPLIVVLHAIQERFGRHHELTERQRRIVREHGMLVASRGPSVNSTT